MNCCFYHCKGLFKRRILSGCNIILFALLLCSYSYLLAGEKLLPVYDFRKIDRVSQNAEGMSKEQITSRVVRDNHGFIWIGTIFGLLRYDGYIVHTYRHDPKDPYSLSSNIITALFVDSKQRLWVGTDESGLSLYDARNNWFINFLPRKGDSQWLQSKRVRAIIEDDSGSIWLATRGGIAQVEINVTAESNNIDSLVHSIRFTTYPLWDSSIETYNLIMQNDNTFLIASDSGLVILDHTENKTYSLPFTDQLDHTHLSSIIKDSRGNIWAGAESGEGLFRIDLEAKKLWNYRYKIDDNTSPDSDIIFDLAEDRDGNIWVCSREGVHLFSPRSNSYLSYLTFDRALIGKTDFSKIHIDNIGVIWLSIYGKGVHKFDPNYQCFPGYSLRRGNEYLPITFLTVDRDYKGNFWFFSIEGILYQIDIDKLQIIKSIDVFKGQKPLQYVFNDSFLDANGTYWYGSMGLGLFRVDLTSGQVKNYGLEAGLGKNLTVNSIAQGRGDTLWTATYLEGLMKFDPLSQKFIRVPGLPYTVWSIMRDRTGRIWISAGIDGIIIFDPVSGKKEYLRNDPADPNSLSGSVCYSFEDKEGRIWVGAGTVIDLWEPSNRSFIHYPEKEFSCAVKIDPIGYDSKGRLWSRCLGPGLTVSIINPVSRKYTNFAHEQGINGGNMVSLPDGRIIKTGGYGINIFDLDSIQFKRPAPPLVLTRLNINNEPVVSPHLTKNLKLTYTQNLLEFEFAAISVNVPTQIRYQYQLAGLENSWMDPPKIQEVLRYVKYSNLDPGNYIFKVKATSPYGDWQEQQISLPISISPPWWETKIAYTFYVILIVLTVFIIWRFQTNRLKMEQQLQMEHFEAEKLREVDQMKSRFFANISHEFRTPLTLIKGPVKQMLDGKFIGNLKDQYRIILRNSDRLLGLINQILDLSKLESGEIKLKVAETDIVKFIKGLVLSFSPLAETKKVILKFFSSENSIIGYIDQDKLEKIITNLLSNAFKFTPEKGKIEVRISPTPLSIPPLTKGGSGSPPLSKGRQGGVAEIKISNTGLAIPPDKLDKIFDRFYQADTTYKKDGEGSGIGLALTKELVEVHHGKIKVESEVNKGTTFTVWLPIQKEHFKPEEIVEESVDKWAVIEPTPQTPPLVRGDERGVEISEPTPIKQHLAASKFAPLLLIVEDNPDVTSYITSFMKNDHRILTAENGKEGFKKALDKYPDLIISDVMMPEMDGFELCHKLKSDENTSHIPIILLTAKADMDSKIEGLEFGCDDYISKPFDARELHARVKNLIEQRKILRGKFAQTIEINPGEITASSMDEQFLKRLLDVFETHVADSDFSTGDFAREVGMSRSNLHRKLQALTNQPTHEFLRSLRLKRAAQLLKKSTASVTEVAYAVGFNNLSHFTKIFRQQFGQTPSAFAKKNQ